jgi:hypothetical protein
MIANNYLITIVTKAARTQLRGGRIDNAHDDPEGAAKIAST